jgi:hypothetical protein
MNENVRVSVVVFFFNCLNTIVIGYALVQIKRPHVSLFVENKMRETSKIETGVVILLKMSVESYMPVTNYIVHVLYTQQH